MSKYISESRAAQLICSPAYADIFVRWYMMMVIDTYESIEWPDLWNLMEENLGVEDELALFRFAEANFKSGDDFSLSETQIEIVRETKDFYAALQNSAIASFSKEFYSEDANEVSIAVAFAKGYRNFTKTKDADIEMLFLSYLLNKEDYLMQLASSLNGCDESRLISSLCLGRYFDAFCQSLRLATLGDLRAIDPIRLGALFFPVMNVLVRRIRQTPEEAAEAVKTQLEEAKRFARESMGDDYYAFVDGQGVGKKLAKASAKEMQDKYALDSLAVERIKNQTLARVQTLGLPILDDFVFAISPFIADKTVFSYEVGESYFSTFENDFIALLASMEDSSVIRFSRKYMFYYTPDKLDEEYALSSIESQMPDYISQDEPSGYFIYQKKVLAQKWSRRKEGYYIRKGLTELDLVTKAISSDYPNGFRVSRDYEDLCRRVSAKYGHEFRMPSASVLTWSFQKNDGFCLIDRGTYMPWSRCPELNLLEQMEILSYVQGSGDIVYYRTILEHFKEQFARKGVSNSYFVKGLVDKYIGLSDYEKTRDYLKKTGTDATGRSAIMEKIESFTGPFSMQQLRNAFPGIKDYQFLAVLQSRYDVISLGRYRYVLLANCGVTDKGEEMIINAAKETVEKANGTPVTARKVLSRIKLFQSDWEEQLGAVTNATALFAYLSRADSTSQSYLYRRPYLADKGSDPQKMNLRTSLFDELSKKDSFTREDMLAIIKRLGINKNNPINFMDVFEEMSDEYVLIDRFEMEKASKSSVTREQIDAIRDKVGSIVMRRGLYASDAKSALAGMPKVIGGHPLNPYIVLGVVATYLQREFEFEVTPKGSRLDYRIKEAK